MPEETPGAVITPDATLPSETPTDSTPADPSVPGVGTPEDDTAATSGAEGAEGGSDADELEAVPDDAPDWYRERISKIAEQRRAARDEAAEYRQKWQTAAPLWEALQAEGGFENGEAALEAIRAKQMEAEQSAREAAQFQFSQKVDEDVAGLVNEGHISAEVAPFITGLITKMNQVEPMVQQFQQYQEQQAAEQKATATIATLKKDFPSLDEDTVRLAIRAGDDPARHAKRTHEAGQKAVAAYNAQTARVRQSAPPETGTGQAPAPVSLDPNDPDYIAKWQKQLSDAEAARVRYGARA